jgi:hypothetical protein
VSARRTAARLVQVAALGLVVALGGSGCSGSGDAVAGTASAADPGAVVTSTDQGDGPSASATPTPTPYDGRVFAVGDSVMLGAATCLEPLGIKVDAAESRSFYAGADLLLAKAEDGRLPKRVVIHLGTNGPMSTDDLTGLLDDLDGTEVYWINVHLPDLTNYAYADEVNAMLKKVAKDHPTLHVVDWDATAEQHAGWLYPDRTHLTPKGCEGFARMVDEAVRAPLPAE